MESNKSGFEPKNIWIARRKKQLRSAIIDLLNQYHEVPKEWIDEYNNHTIMSGSIIDTIIIIKESSTNCYEVQFGNGKSGSIVYSELDYEFQLFEATSEVEQVILCRNKVGLTKDKSFVQTMIDWLTSIGFIVDVDNGLRQTT
ncbi:hypothetical protein JOE44_001942 [Chryseobacterium sp. PvR013]|uniref:hypothetical protein n=1 Tax=Chryseobacterium sp. PvR013 TaxID=2806595 RepID=UPI001AE39E4A|nr:hypothetical protein [Chryseobacterium sp. PvR013]MBP1165058.1 hypothetical protein [Chryseobacterium sp. PvR013]